MSPNRKKNILIAAYVLTVGVACIYLLFPEESIRRYFVHRCQQLGADVNVSIQGIRPAFPPGLRLIGVSATWAAIPIVDMDRLDIRPRLLSLLGSERQVDFHGKIHGGVVRGFLRIRSEGEERKIKLETVVQDVDIRSLPLNDLMQERNVSGRLDAEVRYDATAPDEMMTAKLKLTQGAINIISPILPIHSLTYDAIDADATVAGNRVRIDRCQLKGREIDAAIQGEILLQTPLQTSRLALNGTVKPHKALLADLKKTLPPGFFPKGRSGEVDFPVTLTGTLDQPGFSLR